MNCTRVGHTLSLSIQMHPSGTWRLESTSASDIGFSEARLVEVWVARWWWIGEAGLKLAHTEGMAPKTIPRCQVTTDKTKPGHLFYNLDENVSPS
jgi:hypothetical protein